MTNKRKDSSGKALNEGESQRKDGRYIYRWTNRVGERQIIYANSLKELRKKEERIAKDIFDGIDYNAGEITFETLLELYISQKRNIKHSSRHSYENKLSVIRRHPISAKRIRDIKSTDIKAFLINLYDNGRNYGTLSEYLILMKAAFNVAVDDDLIRKNPIRFKLSTVIKNNSKERKALTADEKKRYLDYLKNDRIGKKYYHVAVILLGTGLRISELCGLTRADVDFRRCEIHVTKQLEYTSDNKYAIGSPKSKTGTRVIPMSKEVSAAFRYVITNRKKTKVSYIVDGVSDFIFLTTHGTPKIASRFEYVFRRLIKKYNATHNDKLPDITPHVLRHTFCTDMINAGMNPKHVQYLMGHAKLEITMNVYSHTNSEIVKDAFARIIGI